MGHPEIFISFGWAQTHGHSGRALAKDARMEHPGGNDADRKSGVSYPPNFPPRFGFRSNLPMEQQH